MDFCCTSFLLHLVTFPTYHHHFSLRRRDIHKKKTHTVTETGWTNINQSDPPREATGLHCCHRAALTAGTADYRMAFNSEYCHSLWSHLMCSTAVLKCCGSTSYTDTSSCPDSQSLSLQFSALMPFKHALLQIKLPKQSAPSFCTSACNCRLHGQGLYLQCAALLVAGLQVCKKLFSFLSELS